MLGRKLIKKILSPLRTKGSDVLMYFDYSGTTCSGVANRFPGIELPGRDCSIQPKAAYRKTLDHLSTQSKRNNSCRETVQRKQTSSYLYRRVIAGHVYATRVPQDLRSLEDRPAGSVPTRKVKVSPSAAVWRACISLQGTVEGARLSSRRGLCLCCGFSVFLAVVLSFTGVLVPLGFLRDTCSRFRACPHSLLVTRRLRGVSVHDVGVLECGMAWRLRRTRLCTRSCILATAAEVSRIWYSGIRPRSCRKWTDDAAKASVFFSLRGGSFRLL